MNYTRRWWLWWRCEHTKRRFYYDGNTPYERCYNCGKRFQILEND